MTIQRLVMASAAVLIASAAQAQDYSLPPTFGQAALQTGFLPDPQTISLTAGGPIDAARSIGGDCVGFIADPPDFRLFYESGSQYDLTIFAQSRADTTLVINAPDGSWHCNDDADGFDPAVIFGSPLSGQYDIWVGTYVAGQYPPATLGATELIDAEDGETSAPAEPMTEPEAPADQGDDAKPGDDAAAGDSDAEQPQADQPPADQSGGGGSTDAPSGDGGAGDGGGASGGK